MRIFRIFRAPQFWVAVLAVVLAGWLAVPVTISVRASRARQATDASHRRSNASPRDASTKQHARPDSAHKPSRSATSASEHAASSPRHSSQSNHHASNPSQPRKPDCHKVKCLALSFDDGPNKATTPKILEALEAYHAKATFFVVGSRVLDGNQPMLKRMHKDGDEIGNHSWSHPDFTKLKPKQIKQQISRTQAVVAATGAPAPTLFRPPYAAVNKKVQTNVPLTIMLWDEDPRDWATDSAKKVAKSVIKQAQPGGIVDLHDLDPSTAKAVPAILKNLHKQHYHLVTISYLLNLHKAHPGKVYDYHTLVQTSAGKLDQ